MDAQRQRRQRHQLCSRSTVENMLLLLGAASMVCMLPRVVQGTAVSIECQSDQDCKALNDQLSSTASLVSEWTCIARNCTYVVSAGSICRQSSDCAHYQNTVKLLAANKSLLMILGDPLIDSSPTGVKNYLDSICNPQYCTLNSKCNSVSGPLFSSTNSLAGFGDVYSDGAACCAGGHTDSICENLGTGSISGCDALNTCQLSSNITDFNYYCAPRNLKNTLWIGILITLIGAAMLNVGLNLQKLALQKRQKKRDEKRLERNLRIVQKVATMKNYRFPHFLNLKRLSSRASPVPMTHHSADDAFDPNEIDERHPSSRPASRNSDVPLSPVRRSTQMSARREVTHFGIEIPRPTIRVINKDTFAATVVRPDGTMEDISIAQAHEEKPEFQKNLNFGSLIKNPVWILGFLIFTFSSTVNFIALKFAPQSLVGPLGSISLVVNVIVAPLINHEKWSWKDLFGVALIVIGSALTVVFAGHTDTDFKLCLLLALFTQGSTIAFLITTVVLAYMLFLLICFIEKNLDVGEHGPKVTVVESAPPLSPALTDEASSLASIKRWGSKIHLPKFFGRRESANSHTSAVRPEAHHNGRSKGDRESVDGSGSGTPPAAPSTPRLFTIPSEKDLGDAIIMRNEDTDRSGRSTPVKNSGSPRVVDAVVMVEDDADPSFMTGLFTTSPPVPLPPGELVRQTSLNAPTNPALAHLNDDEYLASASIDIATNGLMPPPRPDSPAPLKAVNPARPEPSEADEDERDLHPTAQALQDAISQEKRKKQTLSQRLLNWFPVLGSLRRISVLPRLKNKIPVNSRAVRVVLPFSYASLGGLMATITVLFGKATVHLLSSSLFEGDNQYDNAWAYVITGVTVVTAVGQIYWINMGLQRYDALLQVPVFYVVWTLFDILGGGIYFGEFSGFGAKQIALFVFSVSIIFTGVIVLADRLKGAAV